MKNKFPIWFNTLISISLILVCLFILLFFLKHAFYFSLLDKNLGERYYPNYYQFLQTNFHGLIYFIGSNAILFFYLFIFVFFSLISIILKRKIKNKRDFKIYLLGTFFLLLLSEICLRFLGFTPGVHSNYKFFRPVDKLWSYYSYEADENGILKVDSKIGRIISKRIKNRNPNYGGREYGEVYCLSKEFIEFKNGQTKNDFFKFCQKIDHKKVKSDLDSAILNYTENPINTEGFFSIEHKKYNSKKPVILLLGDSFTWGHSAIPKTNSFAHLLMSKGYVVFNTGISATDVAQYLTVAKKYIKDLKPDFVIVNFFMGNDVNYYKREVKPFNPVFYCTNAGNINSSYGEKSFKNKEEAYDFVLSQLKIPQETCLFNKIMAKSTITSMTWGIMKKSNLFPYLENKKLVLKEMNTNLKIPFCNIEIKEIESLCKENSSKFILSCIPEVMSSKIKRAKDVSFLFQGLKYYEMNVTKSDYNLDDGHFNEQGHRKYAAFLDRIIKSKIK